MTIEQLISLEEGQTFDRKSSRIALSDLAVVLTAMANADGGIVAVGISDKMRSVEGVDNDLHKLNELLRVPVDYCQPSVPVRTELVPCVDKDNKPNHILVFHIEASAVLHATQADEVYVRIGDKSKKLSFQDRTQLMYDKGMRYYEDMPVANATINDLDLSFVHEYCQRIGYTKSAEEYLRENKGFVTRQDGQDRVSVVAMLLFGKRPQDFLPCARVRYIRYDGTEEKVGAQMNVIKDVMFEGNILQVTQKAIAYLDTQVKERTFLGHDGLFKTIQEYPPFVRQELIVNAVTHRDYSITGTDIQVKLFDDRLVVESPGKLPGAVTVDNIRHTHFSRNPKIAAFMRDYEYVREFGEGVDRMYRELANVSDRPISYEQSFFMLRSTAYRNAEVDKDDRIGAERNNAIVLPQDIPPQLTDRQRKVLSMISMDPTLSSRRLSELISQENSQESSQENSQESSQELRLGHISERTIKKDLSVLKKLGIIRHIGATKNGHWEMIK